MLRVVEWTPAGDHVWADSARFEDLGLHAVGFRVRDINASWDMLTRHGARERSKPTYWEVEQNVAAWDSQCLDPDGTTLGAFEVVGEIERALGPLPPGRESSEVQIASIHCFDARRCESFYRGLGFEPLHDRMVEHLWHFLGLPAGTKVHKINLIMPGGPAGGRVELVQFVGPQGRSLKARTVPPARGPLMMSFRVEDLHQASAHLQSLGARPIGAARYHCPPFGPVAAATFFGLSDEVIELFETG
jgi:catechol 2,3-dioxygenase-like lactoylglutathione lyase family enzyme